MIFDESKLTASFLAATFHFFSDFLNADLYGVCRLALLWCNKTSPQGTFLPSSTLGIIYANRVERHVFNKTTN